MEHSDIRAYHMTTFPMTPSLLETCCAASFAGIMTFPEIVGKLSADGVEWYRVDLIIGTQTHYAADSAWHSIPWPAGTRHHIGADFNNALVESAIRASQHGEIRFPEFLSRIADAGVTHYTVHMKGRRALYFGRHGDFHIEPFRP